jgi:hypothetical protein
VRHARSASTSGSTEGTAVVGLYPEATSGLIERTVDTTRAATYQLSELGASLAHGPLAALARWAAGQGNTVQAAQERATSPTS